MWPEDLKYTKTHEWAKAEGDVVTMGLTQFAITHLSDLVFIDLPDAGESVTQNESFAEVESVKAVAEVNAPVSGEIIEVNPDVVDNVELVGKDCYGGGWLVKIKMSDPSELDKLMDAKKYQKHAEAEEAVGH
jgi:glycine cleavage system H protein